MQHSCRISLQSAECRFPSMRSLQGNLKAEAEATFAFKVLSSSQTKDLIELDTVDDVQA